MHIKIFCSIRHEYRRVSTSDTPGGSSTRPVFHGPYLHSSYVFYAAPAPPVG